MRIGLLEAETLNAEVVQRFGSYSDMSAALLQSALSSITKSAQHFEFRKYSVDKMQLPQQVEECDAYLITGSRCSAFDDLPWIHKLQEFIKKLAFLNTPCLGICFGHQILAQSLGGKVERSDKGWGIGVATFNTHKSKPWMQPAQHSFNLLISHQDQVVELPADAELLAGNEFCPIEMFQFGDNILGMQAHPEFVPGYVEHLINKRRDNIGPQKVEAGLASLRLPVDSALIGTWMVNFLLR